MSITLIPTINVNSEKKFKEQFFAIEKHTKLVQIDIADGIFTSWKNWHNPKEINKIKTKTEFELHLMIKNPEQEIQCWLNCKNVSRFIIHIETLTNRSLITDHRLSNLDIFLALNPATPLKTFKPYFKNIQGVMLLGVNPGSSGQKFQTKVLKKIKTLRKKYPKLNIEVDGGVNEDNIKDIIKAGANIICLGSRIFNNEAMPKDNFKKFKKMIR